MAVIESGASSDILTIDPTSKAGRVTLYDTAGNALFPASVGEYVSYIETRHTGAAAAGSTVWNFRGPPSTKAYIRRLVGAVGFDGTALAASGTLRYGIYLGTGNASPTGGTVRLAQKKSSAFGAATAVDIRNDLTGAGLTTTSITYAADPIRVIGLPVVQLQVAAPATSATAGALHPFELNFCNPGDPYSRLVIGANEHLAIRVQTVAAIVGLTIMGCLEWAEW